MTPFNYQNCQGARPQWGGKWVYTTKQNQDGIVSFKARYVAKGYNQVKGIDYQETFAPTANITSIRVLMQLAVNHDLVVHQMDVKTAYLHAPIDQEIYIDQPQGFEEVVENGSKLVYRLKKSLMALNNQAEIGIKYCMNILRDAVLLETLLITVYTRSKLEIR